MKIRIVGLPKNQTGGAPHILYLPKDIVKPLRIKDTRKIDVASGKKINSKTDFSKDIDIDTAKQIINEAKKQGIDPYTALAISYQETGINKQHPYDLNPDQYGTNYGDPSLGVRSIASQFQYAKGLQKKGTIPNNETYLIQGYNGYGKIKRGHIDLEGSNSIYGYPIPKEGIDFKKNPLYGKRVLDIRDNILKTNPEIQKLVNDNNNFKYGGDSMKVKITGLPESKAGGKWIQKAIDPKHKGYCTPMSKKTCTPARKAFAKRAKAGKLQNGGLPIVDGLQPGMEHLANIEAEAGEVYQDHNGGIQKISDHAPSHEQGGAFIPNAERVLEDTSMDRKDSASKKLKMSPDEVETIFGVRPKRPVSHAKAYEFIKREYAKDTDRYNKSMKVLNDKPHFDRTKYNTAKLNFINREDIPTDQDVFDTLFEHQEAIKAVHGIQNNGKTNKYGGYRMQTGGDSSDDNLDFGLYHGPKYPKDKTNLYTPTGKTSEAKLTDKQIAQAYQAVGQDFTKLKGSKLQEAIYNYLAENQPDVLKQTLQEYGANRKALTSGAGKLKAFADPLNATPDDLKKAIPYLVDNMPGARIPLPSSSTDKPNTPNPIVPSQPAEPSIPAFKNPNPIEPDFTNNPVGRNNRFYEPTYWYDLAPGMAELADSFRRLPELYNPVDIHTLRLQQLNPEAALRANQGDYRAALHALGNNDYMGAGARAANISNLTAQKYKANNQIIGEYTNRNADIKNREISYNTQARDRQSMYDADSRQKYYANVLQSRDNQRLQRLQAIQDLSRVQQLKARQNTSGNLILQMSPHFNQEGEYNGTPYHFTLPADIMGDGSFIPTDQPVSRPVSPRSTTRTTWRIGDKNYTTTVTNPQ